MSNDDQLEALERLAKLRDNGALSAEEFTAQKTALLSRPDSADVPFYRRLWFVVLLTCLILTFPIALVILLTGNVYKKSGGMRVPIGNTARYVYASVLGLWLAAVILRSIVFPAAFKKDWADAASPAVQTASVPAQPAMQSNTTPTPTTTTAAPPAPPDPNSGAASADDSSQQQPSQASDGPSMQVEAPQTGPKRVVITGDDDKPFTISRMIFNDRENQTGCDYPDHAPPIPPELKDLQSLQKDYGSPFAKTLQRGDQATYFADCGQILSVQIVTDRGTVGYKFDGN